MNYYNEPTHIQVQFMDNKSTLKLSTLNNRLLEKSIFNLSYSQSNCDLSKIQYHQTPLLHSYSV